MSKKKTAKKATKKKAAKKKATKKKATKKKAAKKKTTKKKTTKKKSAKKKSAKKKTTKKKSTKKKASKKKKATTARATGDSSVREDIESTQTGKSYVAGRTFGLREVTYSEVDGDAIFEGDILLGTVEEMETVRHQIETWDTEAIAESVVVLPQFRWPDGNVFFRIDPSLTNQARVTGAIAHWEAHTNIRFLPRTTQRNYVTFRPGGGCSANVGMRGGEQFVNLGPGCTLGNTIHEIGHTVGLWHEQSREDRDNFVTIVFSNIRPNAVHNFNQHISDGDDIGGYDYGSIMHYPANAFAIDRSQPTIIAPQPIGQRTGLSAGDIAAVNAIYPRKAVLNDTSTNGPIMATKGNELLLGWTGTGNLRLNFMKTTDGLSYTRKVTLGDISTDSLGLTVFRGKYFVAWTGVGNNLLNIMQSSDGSRWTNKVTLRDTSLSAPALTAIGNTLYLSWRGVGNNRLNVMRSSNGRRWTNKVTLRDTTTSGPALGSIGQRLFVGWRGVGNNRLNVLRSTNGSRFTNKLTMGETTVSRPSMVATSGGRLLYTWQGVGNRRLNVLSSTNGSRWQNKFTSNETCIGGPTIATVGADRHVWGWTGTDRRHRLNSKLINVS